MKKKTVGFVIPAYNPSLNWTYNMGNRLSEIKCLLDEDVDIVLVISPDGSKRGHSSEEIEILYRSKAIRDVIHLENKDNRGKGHAVRRGLHHCDADYYVYTDWDFPFTNESYADVINCIIRDGVDVLLPYRRNYIKHLSSFRKILSKLSHFANKIFFLLPSCDTQAGLKCFNARGKDAMLSTGIDTYLFDTEFVVLSVKKRLAVKIIDVDIRDGISLSSMKMKVVLVEIFNMFKILYKRWFC